MASTSTPLPSSSPSPSQNENNSTSSVSSSLYLFTFLATLFLLLLISCAIVLRSFLLRRRFRRRVDEALAAGIFLSPTHNGRRDVGETPKFYDVWLAPGDGKKWDSIMPVSGDALSSKHFTGDQASAPTQDHEQASPHQSTASSFRIGRSLRNPFSRRRVRSSPPCTPISPEIPVEAVNEEGTLRVSVFVTMPSTRQKEPMGEELDEEVPDVVIGVAEVPYNLGLH